MNKIIFVGNARDFHAIDWYRTIKRICVNQEVIFATDLIYSEGHSKIVDQNDNIKDLYNIDRFLLDRQSSFGNVWRNLIKLLFFPVQVIALKKIAKGNPDAVYHAHTMYYLFICWLAGIRYIGSPQGDEILIRPYKSSLYKYFAKQSLAAAEHLIVDSVNLQNGIRKLCGKEAEVIQYGIDVEAITKVMEDNYERLGIISIRAWYPLYRIEQIIKNRNKRLPNVALTFFFPFSEEGYVKKIISLSKVEDKILGRLSAKNDVYKILAQSELAISIPESDSSPRSVYEAIFCGCAVAVSYNSWIESLPLCMKARIIVVEINDPNWIYQALELAEKILISEYIPSNEAIEMFDQEQSMLKVANKFYI